MLGCLEALFFTVRMKFVNILYFKHALDLVRGKFEDQAQTGEVSHFQALTTALSATVGLGNIAGVAIAIGVGGPGATFWMILVGFLGMSSKFTECTLGQKYRKVRKDGRIMGGAMHYLSEGLKEKTSLDWVVSWQVFFVYFALVVLSVEEMPSKSYNPWT